MVAGTTADDRFLFELQTNGNVQVTAPDLAPTMFSSPGQVRVLGYEGNDSAEIQGTDQNDTFTISGEIIAFQLGTVGHRFQLSSVESSTVDGQAGNDTFAIHGTNVFENLRGGNGDDTFVFSDGAVIPGNVDGNGGYNTLDYSQLASSVTVDRRQNAATGIGGAYANISRVIGGGEFDMLIGANTDSTWNITGQDSGNIGGAGTFDFQGFENLHGGSGNDAFIFSDGAGVSGDIHGDGGYDTLDYSQLASAVTVDRQQHTASGVGGAYANISRVIGGGEFDTLIGANTDSIWNITGQDSGNLGRAGTCDFQGFENLRGGTADDTFRFATGGSVWGNIAGNGGYDTLDYSQLSTAVTVDRQQSIASRIGGAYAGISQILGGSVVDTLIGADVQSQWAITESNAIQPIRVSRQHIHSRRAMPGDPQASENRATPRRARTVARTASGGYAAELLREAARRVWQLQQDHRTVFGLQ